MHHYKYYVPELV
jgi:hypothetical protein